MIIAIANRTKTSQQMFFFVENKNKSNKNKETNKFFRETRVLGQRLPKTRF